MTASIIVWHNGTQFARKNMTTGVVTTNADAQIILQGAIDELTQGGRIFVRKSDYLYSLNSGGLTISTPGIQLIGESVTDQLLGDPNQNSVRLWSNVAGRNFIKVDADFVRIENILFNSAGTNQTGLLVKEAKSCYFDNLVFKKAFENAVHINPETSNANDNYFGKLNMQEVVNGFVVDGTGQFSSATQSGLNQLLITGWKGVGLWFKNSGDSWTMNRVHITSPTAASVTAVRVSQSGGASWTYSQHITHLSTVVSDPSDIVLDIWPDNVQGGFQVPITILNWNEGSTLPTTQIKLNDGAPPPIYSSSRDWGELKRGLNTYSIETTQ